MAICTTVLRITSANVLTEVLLIQGSVLGPILFLLFINDLIEHCATYSEIYLFADDAKLFKHILSDSDQEMLQKGVDELYKWTIEWLLNLNISKCKVISFGRNADKTCIKLTTKILMYRSNESIL